MTLRGYLKTEDRPCAWVEDGSCEVTYATFVVLDADHRAFPNWMEDMGQNAFAGESGIGVGCYDEAAGEITYINDGLDGAVEGTISGADFNDLAESSPNNLVTVRVARFGSPGGRGAPECYSHFRNLVVL